MQRLLVLACSATKTPDQMLPVPPMDYYDGPVWRTFRAWRERSFDQLMRGSVEVYALSAEYGLVHAARPIDPYDRQMTDSRAEFLRASGHSTGTVMPTAFSELERVVGDWETPDVLFVGSALYASVFASWMDTAQPDVMWRAACDGARGIGDMMSELKLWLDAPQLMRESVPVQRISEFGRLI